MLAIVEELQE
jgi:hypothetical protein